MSEAIRLALVGCGGISSQHLNGFRELYQRGGREIVFTACCDPNQDNARQRAAELAEIQGRAPAVFGDSAALLKSGCADGADLCLPHYLHHRVAEELLAGGLNVVVEKPLGLTLAAGRRMIAAARDAGKILATAENTRRWLPSRACAWAIRERKLIGDILGVNVQIVAPSAFDYDKPMFKWRGVKLLTGGGLLMDSGAHFADMQMVLFGEPEEIYCTLATRDQRVIADAPLVGSVPPDIEDAWHAVIRFKSGVQTVWTYSRSHPTGVSQVGHYYGTGGLLEDLGWKFHCFQGGGQATLTDGKVVPAAEIERDYLLALDPEAKARLFPHGCTNSFGVTLWDFADAIRAGRKPEMDGEDGLRSQALCVACYESAACGQPVKYADVLAGRVDAYQRPLNEHWKIAAPATKKALAA